MQPTFEQIANAVLVENLVKKANDSGMLAALPGGSGLPITAIMAGAGGLAGVAYPAENMKKRVFNALAGAGLGGLGGMGIAKHVEGVIPGGDTVGKLKDALTGKHN